MLSSREVENLSIKKKKKIKFVDFVSELEQNCLDLNSSSTIQLRDLEHMTLPLWASLSLG